MTTKTQNRVDDLEGIELDYWVATAEGQTVKLQKMPGRQWLVTVEDAMTLEHLGEYGETVE